MDVLQSENVEDMLIDETINNVPLSSISQQQNETVTELNVLNSRKRQREVKQTTEETSSEKKGKQDRETNQDEDDIKEFQRDPFNMITNRELDVSDLKDVIKALKQCYFPNHKFIHLGLQLGLLQPTLADIKANHKDDVESCLRECLTRWLCKADEVTENGSPTWDSLADALHKIEEKFAAEKIMAFKFSTPACQMLQKQSDQLSQLTLPVEIVHMLYAEEVITKETLNEVKRLGRVLGDGPLRALCSTVYKDPCKLKLFANILLKFEETVTIAKNLLNDYWQKFPFKVKLNTEYQYKFDQMKVAYGTLIMTVSPLIEVAIPSLKDLKMYLHRCFQEIRPQLKIAKSFDDVMDVVQDKCTIINVCCLEGIVDYYNITDAKPHITNFKTAVNVFCEQVRTDICFNIAPSDLKCETIEFVLQWNTDEHTLGDIHNLLLKAFDDMATTILVKKINEGNSIILTCYAPQYMMDILLVVAKDNLDLLKELGVIKLTFGYITICDEHKRNEEIRTMIEEDTKKLRDQLELQKTINQTMTMKIKRNEEMRKVKEKQIEDLSSSLRGSEKKIEELEQKLKGYTGDIEWCDDRIVELNLPNMEQCEEVVNKLKEEKQLGQEWSIRLKKSSPEIALAIISDLNECAVTTLDIRYTPLTSSFMSTLSDILSKNKTLKRLNFCDSPFSGGDMKQLSTAISTNTTIEELVLENVTVTDKDATYLSDMLRTNQTLKLLRLITCNITDNGIHNIHEGLVKNKAITRLFFSNNPQITSASTNVIVDLMKNTKSLKELHLAATSLEEKDIETICNALVKIDTMEILMLCKKHQEHCQTLDCYDDIKSKLHFW